MIEKLAYNDFAQLKSEGMAIEYDVIHASERFAFGLYDWRSVFGTFETTLAAPHVWIPKPIVVSPVELVAAAAALAIVKNPVVTRRFWQGWIK